MKTMLELGLKIGDADKTIYFGLVDNSEELQEMFRLRYDVYASLNYLNTAVGVNSDKDSYDIEGSCQYFIAKVDGRIIGTVRLIQSEFLPTEKDCFSFQEPVKMQSIPRASRAELG